MSHHELSGWRLSELRYELAYQQADGIHTWGPGRCGHDARGSGFCANCLIAEIGRRDELPDGSLSKSTMKRRKVLAGVDQDGRGG